MTVSKAKAYAQKLDNCVGFSLECDKRPSEKKEFLIHFKEGRASIQDIGKWHTYLVPKNSNAEAPKSNSLAVPRRSKGAHARTVTNFCKEANIAESDQLDLAEFIVAARYLGTDANDEQLMNVFIGMEDADDKTKDPKQLIKDLMAKVDEEYGFGDDGKPLDPLNEDANEILAVNPLDAFAEDAIWQEDQIDSFLVQNQNDQNLKIARNLLATTALTRHEIAEITGVDADALKDYESDYSTDEESESEEDEEQENDDKAENKEKDKKVTIAINDGDNKEKKEQKAKGVVAEGVTIRATDFSKSVMLTKDDLGALKEIIDGGQDKVKERSEDGLKLLKKLNNAININPKGHSKRTKTLAKLKVDKIIKKQDDEKEDKIKLPSKYRVVIHPGALCKKAKELASGEVCKLPIGTVCTVEEIDGRRCRISSPSAGWLSLHASDGRVILQRCNVKSAAMDKAIHAERARQTKVLILKSITTLNDATVTRILEKSDWNLRRAIEAFYIAKYKTQEYLSKKEKNANKHGGKKQPQSKADKEAKKKKGGWWKSWKTFTNDNA